MSEFYEAYLRTPYWKRTRAAALRRAGFACEQCGAPAENVHHLTYVRLGEELPEDLLVCCRLCHLTAHGRRPTIEPDWVPCPRCTLGMAAGPGLLCTACWYQEELVS